MASQHLPPESKTINISCEQYVNGFTAASWRIQTINHVFTAVPGDCKTIDISIAKMCKWLHRSLLEISNHESTDSLGARARGTPDKASKPASNLFEPTCKADTGVAVSPAKLKPNISLWGPRTVATGRHKFPNKYLWFWLSQPASEYHQNIIG